jgi:hypothetical protein
VCTGESQVHFIEVATTHWLGGQHGEESKGEEETREEGEAEGEALRMSPRSSRRSAESFID